MGIGARLKRKVIGRGVARPAPLDAAQVAGTVLAPVTGELVAMEDIPDAPLAAGLLGEAVGVWPSDEPVCAVYAPISGTITGAVPSTVTIEADDGTKLLLRIGLGTQEMRGQGFTLFVGRRGDVVEAGECILQFDRRKVEKAGLKDIVCAVVTNPGHFSGVSRVPAGRVAAGSAALTLAPRNQAEAAAGPSSADGGA